MKPANVIAALTMLFILAPESAHAQVASKLEFEAASVRPAGPSETGLGMSGGPGTADPSRLRYVNVPLYRIFAKAFGLRPYDVIGPPWMNEARYDIVAKIPDGTTEEQLAIMLQNLLAERFHLTMHHETREQTVYHLNVGRNGPKLKASLAGNAPPLQLPEGPLKLSVDGFPDPLPGRAMVMRFSTREGTLRLSGQLQTSDEMAEILASYVVKRFGLIVALTAELLGMPL